MELLQFRYFCDAAKSGSFSAAAKKRGVPPSAVSQSIRRLENELGAKLFTRCANKIALNAKGERFYARIDPALCEIDGAVSDVSENTAAVIRICVNAHRSLAAKAIGRYQRLYPGVDLRIRHFCVPTDADFDFMIESNPLALKNYNRYKLVSENLAVAMHRSNPLARRKDFDVSMLKNEQFIILQRPSSMYDFTQKICEKHGFKPHIAIQTDDPAHIPAFLGLGLGVCIVAARSAAQWKDLENILILPIENCIRDTYVYYPKRGMSSYAEKFLDMLIAEFKEQ
ncbi:MAG: LysR family transcriptional regulator [Clostridia bacterium]|nr:LysR family transcriptional regulator [Clostridia bacterium]